MLEHSCVSRPKDQSYEATISAPLKSGRDAQRIGVRRWQGEADGKQPYYFTRRDGAPITIVGLWDEWRDRQAGETIGSCAMIITDANEFVGELHDRMPVIIEPEQCEAWLTGTAGLELLKPAANDVLQCWPVSRRVNSSRAPDDDASLIEPVAVRAGGAVQQMHV